LEVRGDPTVPRKQNDRDQRETNDSTPHISTFVKQNASNTLCIIVILTNGEVEGAKSLPIEPYRGFDDNERAIFHDTFAAKEVVLL
jgi:hypothetical protein